MTNIEKQRERCRNYQRNKREAFKKAGLTARGEIPGGPRAPLTQKYKDYMRLWMRNKRAEMRVKKT